MGEYVRDRERVLASVPTDRDGAKLLFIRLIYGGHWDAWCREYGVAAADLPEIVTRFRADQEEVRRLDAEGHADLLDKLRAEDAGRAEERLQYVLNTQEERRVIDAVEQAVRRLGGEVMAIRPRTLS